MDEAMQRRKTASNPAWQSGAAQQRKGMDEEMKSCAIAMAHTESTAMRLLWAHLIQGARWVEVL